MQIHHHHSLFAQEHSPTKSTRSWTNGFFLFLDDTSDISISRLMQISFSSSILNDFSLSLWTSSRTLKADDTTGCWRETPCMTFVHRVEWWASASAAVSLPSLSLSVGVVSSNCFFAARGPKKLVICCAVSTSSGWNMRAPPWSRSKPIDFETSCGLHLRNCYICETVLLDIVFACPKTAPSFWWSSRPIPF